MKLILTHRNPIFSILFISTGLTQMDQISDIWTQKSSIYHLFNPLNPPYQGDFKTECVSPNHNIVQTLVYLTKLWTIFLRTHISPRWGLGLGGLAFLYTYRPAGAAVGCIGVYFPASWVCFRNFQKNQRSLENRA